MLEFGSQRKGTAKDFKAFAKISGMTHVRTSPFYPQSNGKIERYHTPPEVDLTVRQEYGATLGSVLIA